MTEPAEATDRDEGFAVDVRAASHRPFDGQGIDPEAASQGIDPEAASQGIDPEPTQQAVDAESAPPAVDASLAHLHGRLAVLEARVRAVVERRRQADPDADDRFRGLYISSDQVDRLFAAGRSRLAPPPSAGVALLARIERDADTAAEAGAVLRLRRLADSFGLDDLDVELLLVALAPDLDQRFERFYAYLNDDVTRRRPSAGLALELCTGWSGSSDGRARLGPGGRLVRGDLLAVEEQDRPFLTRPLRVPDRVTAHLLGDDASDVLIADLVWSPIAASLGSLSMFVKAYAAGTRLWYVRERTGAAGTAVAAAAFAANGVDALALDMTRLAGSEDLVPIAAAAVREALLRGGGLLVGSIDTLAERSPTAVRTLAEASCPVILVGARTWDPAWASTTPLVVDAPLPHLDERAQLWREALRDTGPVEGDPAATCVPFRLNPDQMRRAARAASQLAAAAGHPLGPSDLLAGARAQNASGLERLSRRVAPRARWDDLVLPGHVLTQLRELTARGRHRDRVLDDWGMGERSSKGRGITALFAGDSGTGKTMSAEIVAGDLGLDLYVIDLSTVVDKYIGETEKNLDRIFGEADRVNAVLLFDEADAIFGKRSEVRDARDRYANVEIAYLLQRMELFDGLAILTTNLRSNLDEAFLRRLDAIVDFPMPDEGDRQRLWRQHLRPGLPREAELDFEFLARAFKLSGGHIRNICLGAAFLAAAADRPVTMVDLVRATEREYEKLGRLMHEAEFGPYFAVISANAPPWPLGAVAADAGAILADAGAVRADEAGVAAPEAVAAGLPRDRRAEKE